MEIVHNDDDLRIYMATAVKEISHDAPILVDKYIVGKELEIDAICDGEHVYIPGIMEHIERAGIHSGDSISVYPPQTISDKVRDTICLLYTSCGSDFLTVTPGIRLADDSKDDQKRVATPVFAKEQGCDLSLIHISLWWTSEQSLP